MLTPLLLLSLLGAMRAETGVTLSEATVGGVRTRVAMPEGDEAVSVVVLVADRRAAPARVEGLMRTLAGTGVAVVSPVEREGGSLREESARREAEVTAVLRGLGEWAKREPRAKVDRVGLVGQGFGAVAVVRVARAATTRPADGEDPSRARQTEPAPRPHGGGTRSGGAAPPLPAPPTASDSGATTRAGSAGGRAEVGGVVLLAPVDLAGAGVEEGVLRELRVPLLTVVTTPSTRPAAARSGRTAGFELHPGPAYLLTLERVPGFEAVSPATVPAVLARQAEAWREVGRTFLAGYLEDDGQARDLMVSGSVIARFRPHAELEVK